MAFAAMATAGCSTIMNARTAQDAVSAKGSGVSVAVEKVDFRGRGLEWLVGFAMTNRPSVASARLEVEGARLALKSIAADAPLVSATPWNAFTLSASGGHSESSRGTTMRDHKFSTSGGASGALSLDVLVWDFGRYDARAKAQAERVVAAEIALLQEGYRVFEEVSNSYFSFLEKTSLLEVAVTNQAQYAAHLHQAERRLDAGEANRLDVLKARLDLANARQVTVAASNLVATSGAALMNALGVDASRGTCEEAFGDARLPMGEVARAFEHTSYDVDEVFGFARTNAPAVTVARTRLRAASHRVDAAVADLYPSLSASLALNWTDPLWYWRWGVNGAASLFTGWRRTAAVERATVALDSAACDVDTAELKLSRDIEIAVAERDNAVEALAAARTSVRSASENLDTVREQYRLGDASRIDFADAVAGYASSLGDRVRAFYRGQIAEAMLFRLTGRWPEYTEETISEDEK